MKSPWLRRALWPLTIGVLVFLFWTTPVGQVWDSLADAAPWTVPVVMGAVVLVFLADAFAAWKTFSWFAAPLTYGESLVVRGASYPIALINYALGQGAFAYFLHQRRGLPFLRSAGTILLIMGINVLLLLFIVTLGLAVTDMDAVPPSMEPVLKVVRGLMLAGYAGLAVYVLALIKKPEFLKKRAVFEVLMSAGIRGHLKALAVRVPHVGALLLFSYLYLRAFGVDVPLKQILIFMPVAFLVAAVPLPGQGIGVTQLIMREIFSPYATGTESEQQAAVVAAAFAGQVMAMAVQMGVGLICLRSHVGGQLREAAHDKSVEAALSGEMPVVKAEQIVAEQEKDQGSESN